MARRQELMQEKIPRTSPQDFFISASLIIA